MTTNQAFRAMQQSRAVAPVTSQADFPSMLKKHAAEISKALPQHINAERMCRIALTAFRQNPKLAECDPRSVFAAVIQSSQLGLEVGLMGEAHLVPFKKECQLIPGYQGLMKLARNSGKVSDIYAMEVRQQDYFDVVYGLNRTLRHEPLKRHGFPADDEERGEIVGFYAVAKFREGGETFVAMSTMDVLKIRDGSKGYQSAKRFNQESKWDLDFLSMGLKTAIRRLCKFLPKSPELAMALALDGAVDGGKRQALNVDNVIDGVFTPVNVPDDDGNTSNPANQGMGDALAEHLSKVIGELESAPTLEILDAVYLRAESSLNDEQLAIAQRAYSDNKARISPRRPQGSRG